MAKYKFSKESSLNDLLAYFNVSVLSRKQIRQLKSLDDIKLSSILTEMPYFVEKIPAKVLEKNFKENNTFANKLVNNERVVESLNFKQKFALAPALVKENPNYLFDIPNKKLKKLPKEEKFKLIEDATIGLLKTNGSQNITALSEHLVKNQGLFKRNHNFGPELFNSVIDRVSKEFPKNGQEMLSTFFAASQDRLLEAKGKKEIVQKAIDNGVKLGSIPQKLRSDNIIYRAIMKDPENLQFSPKPANKTFFRAFVNATTRKIVLGKDPAKYVDILKQLISQDKNKTLPFGIKLKSSVNKKFITKTLLDTVKRNPQLFIALDNLKELGFSDKTILANKILAVKAMSPTKQKNFFKTLNAKELNELASNMKKLPASTRQNLIPELKQTSEKEFNATKKEFDAKEAAFKKIDAKVDVKRQALKNEAETQMAALENVDKEIEAVDSKMLEKIEKINNNDKKVADVDKTIEEKQLEVENANKVLQDVNAKYKPQLDAIEKSKVAYKAASKAEKAEKKVDLEKAEAALTSLAKDEITLAETSAKNFNDELKALQNNKKTLLAEGKSLNSELSTLLKSKVELEKAEAKQIEKDPRFRKDAVTNNQTIESILNEEFPEHAKARQEKNAAETEMSQAKKNKDSSAVYAYNLEKGRKANAFVRNKVKENIKNGKEM